MCALYKEVLIVAWRVTLIVMLFLSAIAFNSTNALPAYESGITENLFSHSLLASHVQRHANEESISSRFNSSSGRNLTQLVSKVITK